MNRAHFCGAVCVAVSGLFVSPCTVSAATIYGGPTYDSVSGTGYLARSAEVDPAVASGIGAGYAYQYDASNWKGGRAFRWNSSGIVTELGTLGTDSTGYTVCLPYAVNDVGTVVGQAPRYVSGSRKGNRAVRWDGSGTAATELGNLGTDSSGNTSCYAYSVNNVGAAAGSATKYVGGVDKGTRAVRWDVWGTVATELGTLGTNSSGYGYGSAVAINNAGMVAGQTQKYVGGTSLGYRAVRWDASGTTATELGNLGTRTDGSTGTSAIAMSASGIVAGFAQKYDAAGNSKGDYAVRWDASGTAATELASLGVDAGGISYTRGRAVNSSGTVVGYSREYDAVGNYLGDRPVRWDALGTAATELGNLGTDSTGVSMAFPEAINDAGVAVGWAWAYDGSGGHISNDAVMWGQNGIATRLITLVGPGSGWVSLDGAYAISNDNWVSGMGTFDPDGAGSLPAYERFFLMQVPEPGVVGAMAAVALPMLVARKRRSMRM